MLYFLKLENCYLVFDSNMHKSGDSQKNHHFSMVILIEVADKSSDMSSISYLVVITDI